MCDKVIESQLKALETAYVVKMHAVAALAPAQPCFTFDHPNERFPTHIDNSRYRSLRFTLSEGATIHGTTVCAVCITAA